ncbi:MAG: hypothetical protein GY865_05660 [candidate division Zixibacteria bacterium]|nr:hypothetical protein [candidate division Zixibacteria bacterium]
MQNLFKNRTILLLIPFMILVFFSQQSLAVQFRSKSKKKNNHTYNTQKNYPWGLQIALDGNDDENIENYDDFGIRFSLKRQTSKNTAVRFNLGFQGHEVDYIRRSSIESGRITIDLDDNSRFDFTGANLSFQYLYCPNPDNNFQFFWGAGPRLSINEIDPDVVLVYYNDNYFDYYDEIYSESSTKLGLGIEAAVGTEWFLSKHFSLLAEWGLTLQHEWYFFELDNDYYNTFNEFETVSDGLHLDATRIKLGAAFYF